MSVFRDKKEKQIKKHFHRRKTKMSKIIGNDLPNMPWQEKPAGEHMPVWRYDQNPIIGRYEQKRSNSIFNSAAYLPWLQHATQ